MPGASARCTCETGATGAKTCIDGVSFTECQCVGPGSFWRVVRPAVIALDPVFPGDEVGFCTAYGSNSYAPDLVEW